MPYQDYPGYEKRDVISDHSPNDPEHPLETVRSHWRNQTTIFPSRNHAGWSTAWLTSYAKIQSSFTPAERQAGLTGLIERLLVSQAGDAERLEGNGWALKRGVLELGTDPYHLKLKGNLAGGTAWSTLNFGLILNDQDIIRTVAAAVHRYLRSYFTADGLGRESSPHYTHVALSNIGTSMAALEGMKEGFGPGDPFWDARKQALNPFADPRYVKAAYGTLLSVLPDGRCAPWVDSWITEEPATEFMELAANAGGSIPERFAPWLDVAQDARGKFHITLKKELTLPSYLIPANRLAVMRTGTGRDQMFVSVDWSKWSGHSHAGSFNLLIYGARDEMLYDQGYLNDSSPTQAWMASAEAHNTAMVRSANGSYKTWRGSLRFFADTPTVKAVEVAEEGKIFQRTVTLMAAENPYVVDIFRLQGGATHDYYVHSLGQTLTLTGITLRPVADPGQSLYDLSGFTYRTQTGAKAIAGLSRGKTDGTFMATWTAMKDWRSVPPEIDNDAVTRVRILGTPGTEVFAGQAFGQRYIDKRDLEERVKLICVRRKAATFHDVPDAFVAVIDTVRGKIDQIRQVRQLRAVSGDQAGIAVRIDRLGGVDYVLSTTQDNVETTFVDPDGVIPVNEEKLILAGRLGVIRIDHGKKPSLELLQGKRLATVAMDASE